METWQWVCLCIWLVIGVIAAGIYYGEQGSIDSLEQLLELLAAFFWPATMVIMLLAVVMVASQKSVGNVRKNAEA